MDQDRARSGSFEGRKAIFDALGLGLDILEIGSAGLRLGLQLTQIGFQLGDALGLANKPPVKARGMFRMVVAVLMVSMMLALTATAALGLAAFALAAASFLLARALAATGASCVVMAATSAVPMVVASTATPVFAITSAMSAHCFQPPVLT
jgi:hypothetical protein